MDMEPNPFDLFQRWLDEAQAAGGADPRAMTLATATSDGAPSARMVILREFDERGFVFYTDYDSPKSHDLAENPRVALVFYWAPLDRQVRIVGSVSRTSAEESDAHFRTRPPDAQVAVWLRQTRPAESHEGVEALFRDLEQRFPGNEVPRPPFWGGLRVEPASYEFWQGRPDRVHERARYTRQSDGTWRIEQLTP
jgi:pyridoxamine 5'-phosphate oxidase